MRRIGKSQFAVIPYLKPATFVQGLALGHTFHCQGIRCFSSSPARFASRGIPAPPANGEPSQPPRSEPSIISPFNRSVRTPLNEKIRSELQSLLGNSEPLEKYFSFVRRNARLLDPIGEDGANICHRFHGQKLYDPEANLFAYLLFIFTNPYGKGSDPPYACLLRKGNTLVVFVRPTTEGRKSLEAVGATLAREKFDHGNIFEVYFDFSNIDLVKNFLLGTQTTKATFLHEALDTHSEGLENKKELMQSKLKGYSRVN